MRLGDGLLPLSIRPSILAPPLDREICPRFPSLSLQRISIGPMTKKMRLERRIRRAIGGFYVATLRRLMPVQGDVRYNGVIVEDRRFLDDKLPRYWKPSRDRDIPDYEGALVEGLSQVLRAGDKVVVVGGGLGVTVVVAARIVGDEGSVVCFEGSPDFARSTWETAARNDLSRWVDVKCAIVGADIGVYESENGASSEIFPPESLPDCDVLELDCEGAEILVIENMRIKPRAILVETHGILGAPSAAVQAALEGRGYDVTLIGVAEPRMAEICETNDVRVLCGIVRRE
jgi:hypothetical protein